MPISENLREQMASAIEDQDTVDELDEFVDALGEDARDALEDTIAERRAELTDSPSLTQATTAEIIKRLEDDDEGREEVLRAFSDEAEEVVSDQEDEPDGSDEDSEDPEEEEEESDAEEDEPDSEENESDDDKEKSDGENEDPDEAEDDASGWTVGADESLDTHQGSDWDAESATDAILDYAADGDGNVDQDEARRGFLAYDEDADGDEASAYSAPFASIVDGELVADSEGVKHADSNIDQLDVSDSEQSEAQDVIDSYKDEMDIGEEEDSRDGDVITDNLSEEEALDALGDSFYNTLRDVAERMGCDVSEDENIQSLLAKVNEASAEQQDVSVQDLANMESENDGPSARDQASYLFGVTLK